MKRKLLKNRSHISLLLALTFLLTGCGNEDLPAVTSSAVPDSVSVYTESREPIDWFTHQPVSTAEITDGSQWYLTEYYDDWVKRPEQKDWSYSQFVSSPDGDMCCKTQYSINNSDGSLTVWDSLDYFDMTAKNSFHAEVDKAEWGIPEYGYLTDVDLVGDKLVACFFHSFYSENLPLDYCTLVYYHMDNGVRKTLDLLPAMTAAGQIEAGQDYTLDKILCDPEGICYLLLKDVLLIIDENGELMATMEQSDEAPLSYLCKTPAGYPVFLQSSMQDRSNEYWIYDHKTGEIHSMGQSNYMTLNYGCMDSYGGFYSLKESSIIFWDTVTGTRERIFDCNANSICDNTMSEKMMGIRADGNLVIMDPHTEKENIYVLSPNPPEEDRKLTLVSACYSAEMEKTAAAIFSRKTPGVTIEFSGISSTEDRQTYTTNLINRIVAGDAPDMFVVYPDTMRLLYEKGVLADLSGTIPKDLQDQVFDCVWNAGTIDGKLIGLTTKVNTSGMLTSSDTWSGDTWTLEELLELADHSSPDTLEGLIPMSVFRSYPEYLLRDLVLSNIPSSLVDWETGTCHFDSDTFRKLLAYCKNTPVPEANSNHINPAAIQAVRNGEYLAYSCDISGLADFSDQMSLFDDSYHWVGYPTDDPNGNLVYASSFLVVNQNSENMDVIREFLPTLYSDEVQRKEGDTCLRRDILRKYVCIPEWDTRPQFNMGEGIFLLLAGKPDGSSYVEEYIDYMDHCILAPPEDRAIADIVFEEVSAYFSGDKDMDTVINIIQSRVQLYLDENS